MTTGEMRAQLIDKQVMAIQKVIMGNNVREVVVSDSFDKNIKDTGGYATGNTVLSKNSEIKPAYMHLLSNYRGYTYS